MLKLSLDCACLHLTHSDDLPKSKFADFKNVISLVGDAMMLESNTAEASSVLISDSLIAVGQSA